LFGHKRKETTLECKNSVTKSFIADKSTFYGPKLVIGIIKQRRIRWWGI